MILDKHRHQTNKNRCANNNSMDYNLISSLQLLNFQSNYN